MFISIPEKALDGMAGVMPFVVSAGPKAKA